MASVNEAAFLDWYHKIAKERGLDPNPDDPRHHYDYRAAFAAGVGPNETGHWPSQFKAPDHPNRYVGGIDTITGQRVAPDTQGLLNDPRFKSLSPERQQAILEKAGIPQMKPEGEKPGIIGSIKNWAADFASRRRERAQAKAEGLPMETTGEDLARYGGAMASLPAAASAGAGATIAGLVSSILGSEGAKALVRPIAKEVAPGAEDLAVEAAGEGGGLAGGLLVGAGAARAGRPVPRTRTRAAAPAPAPPPAAPVSRPGGEGLASSILAGAKALAPDAEGAAADMAGRVISKMIPGVNAIPGGGYVTGRLARGALSKFLKSKAAEVPVEAPIGLGPGTSTTPVSRVPEPIIPQVSVKAGGPTASVPQPSTTGMSVPRAEIPNVVVRVGEAGADTGPEDGITDEMINAASKQWRIPKERAAGILRGAGKPEVKPAISSTPAPASAPEPASVAPPAPSPDATQPLAPIKPRARKPKQPPVIEPLPNAPVTPPVVEPIPNAPAGRPPSVLLDQDLAAGGRSNTGVTQPVQKPADALLKQLRAIVYNSGPDAATAAAKKTFGDQIPPEITDAITTAAAKSAEPPQPQAPLESLLQQSIKATKKKPPRASQMEMAEEGPAPELPEHMFSGQSAPISSRDQGAITYQRVANAVNAALDRIRQPASTSAGADLSGILADVDMNRPSMLDSGVQGGFTPRININPGDISRIGDLIPHELAHTRALHDFAGLTAEGEGFHQTGGQVFDVPASHAEHLAGGVEARAAYSPEEHLFQTTQDSIANNPEVRGTLEKLAQALQVIMSERQHSIPLRRKDPLQIDFESLVR